MKILNDDWSPAINGALLAIAGAVILVAIAALFGGLRPYINENDLAGTLAKVVLVGIALKAFKLLK